MQQHYTRNPIPLSCVTMTIVVSCLQLIEILPTVIAPQSVLLLSKSFRLILTAEVPSRQELDRLLEINNM